MIESAVAQVKNGFSRFLSAISVTTYEDPNEVIRKAVAEDPTVLYYLSNLSITGWPGGYELRVAYQNKDTDRGTVRTVSSADGCVRLLRDFVGKNKRKLVAVSRDWVDLNNAHARFVERYASFYPNLLGISVSSMTSLWGHCIFEFGFEYRLGQVKLSFMEQDVDREVKRLSNLLFKPGMPDEAKVYLAHNYLATTVRYVNENDNPLETGYTQSAYGALINKQCVCQGTAEAFKRLMDAAGIECDVIGGQVTGAAGLHAWNLVALGRTKAHYHVDVTWDAGRLKPAYDFFCKNDAFFLGKRIWKYEYYPKCDGTGPVLQTARAYVIHNRNMLIAAGIDIKTLDC